MAWILLVLLYGVLKGVREVIKKKSLQKSTIMEVLIVYTFLSFVLVIPSYKDAFAIDRSYLVYIAIKSFIIFLAWICSFLAIDKMPISLYGVLDLSRVLFATLLGVVVLGEALSIPQMIGLVFVCAGLFMLGRRKNGHTSGIEKVDVRYLILAIASCILNAISGMLDKVLMKSVTSGQLQFWYMLFLVLMYLAYVIVTKTKIRYRQVWKNYWIWLLSILFVIADKALFIANGMPDSKLTVMTLIKQSGCVVTILAGKYIFEEKNIRYKLLCAAVVVTGIVIAVM